MLKLLHAALTPDLLWALAAMGHRDRLVLANANYPAHSRHPRVVPLPGVSLAEAARAIAQLMPLDDLGPAGFRMVPDGRPDAVPDVHLDVERVLAAAEGRRLDLAPVDRELFFSEAAGAFVAVATTDNRPYGCFIFAKGVVRAP